MKVIKTSYIFSWLMLFLQVSLYHSNAVDVLLVACCPHKETVVLLYDPAGRFYLKYAPQLLQRLNLVLNSGQQKKRQHSEKHEYSGISLPI